MPSQPDMTSPSFSAGEPTLKRTESGSSRSLATAYTSTLKYKQLNEITLAPSPILSDSLTARIESAKYDRIENRKTSRHPDSRAKVPLLEVMKRYLYFALTQSKTPMSREELITGLGLKDPQDMSQLCGELSILANTDQVIERVESQEEDYHYHYLDENGKDQLLMLENHRYQVVDQENFRDVDFWGFKILDTLP